MAGLEVQQEKMTRDIISAARTQPIPIERIAQVDGSTIAILRVW
jgi:hypothetical protein